MSYKPDFGTPPPENPVFGIPVAATGVYPSIIGVGWFWDPMSSYRGYVCEITDSIDLDEVDTDRQMMVSDSEGRIGWVNTYYAFSTDARNTGEANVTEESVAAAEERMRTEAEKLEKEVSDHNKVSERFRGNLGQMAAHAWKPIRIGDETFGWVMGAVIFKLDY